MVKKVLNRRIPASSNAMGVLAASEFSPDRSLFASVICALDGHRMRIHSTLGDLRSEYTLKKGQECTCLRFGLHVAPSAKKRRRSAEQALMQGFVVAAGLSSGNILLYSTSSGSIVTELSNGHTNSVTDFAFQVNSNLGWSIGADGCLNAWDLAQGTRTSKISLEENMYKLAFFTDTMLIGSHSIQQITLPTAEENASWAGHTNQIHSLLVFDDTYFVSAAEGDRFINVYNESAHLHSLVCSSDVVALALASEVIAAVTAEGCLELFTSPWSLSKKNQSTRQPCKRVIAEDRVIVKANIDGDEIILALPERGARLAFERICWREIEDKFSIPFPQGKKDSNRELKDTYNEANTVVAEGSEEPKDTTNDVEMEPVELSLEERLAAMETSVGQTPNAKSLCSMLTQALRASDTTLLETCLNQTDDEVVFATVKRLDSSLAPELLERVAERMARKPERSVLGIWIRWTLIIHGGHLLSLPQLSKSLSTLRQTLAKRAAMLPKLLALQGRLEMLSTQMNLREHMEESDDAEEYVEDLEVDEGHLGHEFDDDEDDNNNDDDDEDDDDELTSSSASESDKESEILSANEANGVSESDSSN